MNRLVKLWQQAKRAILGRAGEPETATPCAAIYFNPGRSEWIIEPVDLMDGFCSVHNSEARVVVPQRDAAMLPDVVRRAMASSRLLEPAPAPKHPGWGRLVREHHLLYLYAKAGEFVVEPWERQHVGRGGSYVALVDRNIRVPEGATDREIFAAIEEGLRRARQEESAW